MENLIYILDDDEKLNDLLIDYLHQFGYQVCSFTEPLAFTRKKRYQEANLVILDLMLPGMDGFAVLREIRKDCAVPVIMLTARGKVMDRIVGLELGADDYLPKPFEPRELSARIQSILRRWQKNPLGEDDAWILRAGGLELDEKRHQVRLEGRSLDLTSGEFSLLQLLMENSGMVLDRDTILDSLRGIDWEAFDRSIDVLVSRLRHKLNDSAKEPRFIRTVWGRGYMFIA